MPLDIIVYIEKNMGHITSFPTKTDILEDLATCLIEIKLHVAQNLNL
jgi:hypothetical protein